MKLKQVISTIFDQNDDQTIWVESGGDVTPESDVILAFKNDLCNQSQKAGNYIYFLEVYNAQDLIIGLVGEQKIPEGQLINITNSVINYAKEYKQSNA